MCFSYKVIVFLPYLVSAAPSIIDGHAVLSHCIYNSEMLLTQEA